VGPLRDLGTDLTCAIRQLGGDPRQKLGRARRLVVVHGRRYQRLTGAVHRHEALERLRGSPARLGEAVGMVADQVIYRELREDPVEKAIDPRSENGFLRIVSQVSRALRGVTSEAEKDAVRRAIDRLDVDWPHLDGEARRQVVRAANQALAGLPDVVLPKVDEVLGVEARRVVLGTRASIERDFALKIDSDLSRTDERIAKFVAESQSNFIRDELGRRQANLSAKARQIASDGIAQGLGRDEISRQLAEAFRSTTASRNAFYWDVVASAFVNRARSYAEVSSYADAGISHYIVTAVLDEVTTEICRFLDGKRFSVGGAMEQFERVEHLHDPERIKLVQPWLKVGQDSKGNRAIFVPREGRNLRVAIIERSGVGTRDDRGAFRSGLSSPRLEAVGVGLPPFHGLCRTSTVPA
jgi:SPP1 gp7 family putative phage head morphogenesis protein